MTLLRLRQLHEGQPPRSLPHDKNNNNIESILLLPTRPLLLTTNLRGIPYVRPENLFHSSFGVK